MVSDRKRKKYYFFLKKKVVGKLCLNKEEEVSLLKLQKLTVLKRIFEGESCQIMRKKMCNLEFFYNLK